MTSHRDRIRKIERREEQSRRDTLVAAITRIAGVRRRS